MIAIVTDKPNVGREIARVLGAEVSEKVIKLAHEREIVIIMSPYDTFTIARLINQSIPVRYIMKTEIWLLLIQRILRMIFRMR